MSDSPAKPSGTSAASCEVVYAEACRLADGGDVPRARIVLETVLRTPGPRRIWALALNDLATLDALDGARNSAEARLQQALAFDPDCQTARENLEALSVVEESGSGNGGDLSSNEKRTRIAIVSLLFNWPSTGGGIIHTAELAEFLGRAGFEVEHIYARYAPWRIGNVKAALPYRAKSLEFTNGDWTADGIRQRFREAIAGFGPDFVIVTDSWNTKPLLAEAVRDFPYFLRLAGQECLCPLNNVRLLMHDGRLQSCPRQQLAAPDICQQCVAAHQQFSGALHQADRSLGGFAEPGYADRLRRVFAEAAGVLVVNPLIAAMVGPYAKAVHVVPSGFDPARFPWPFSDDRLPPKTAGKLQVFFAGLVEEGMKGFKIVHSACQSLWETRRDFELVITDDPAGPRDEFTRSVGWLSQPDLPRHLRAADMLAFPTVAEEALGRSAVEAMGVGRPVIASRIGGLQFTVSDGGSGLLCEPGNVVDLSKKIALLLDDAGLRERLGQTGRKRFENEFTWPIIIDRHYRKLFAQESVSA